MKIELTVFKIKKGKSSRVDEWLSILNERKAEALLTLKDEKVFVETIFRHKTGEGDFLYWYIIQGEDGKHVSESQHEIDKIHVEFCKECLDIQSYPPLRMYPELHLVPEKIFNNMQND